MKIESIGKNKYSNLENPTVNSKYNFRGKFTKIPIYR